MASPGHLECLRFDVLLAIRHATELLDDLTSLNEAFEVLSSRAALTDDERQAQVAPLRGYDAELRERLRMLSRSLSDVLAGLTTLAGGRARVTHHRARRGVREDAEAA